MSKSTLSWLNNQCIVTISIIDLNDYWNVSFLVFFTTNVSFLQDDTSCDGHSDFLYSIWNRRTMGCHRSSYGLISMSIFLHPLTPRRPRILRTRSRNPYWWWLFLNTLSRSEYLFHTTTARAQLDRENFLTRIVCLRLKSWRHTFASPARHVLILFLDIHWMRCRSILHRVLKKRFVFHRIDV